MDESEMEFVSVRAVNVEDYRSRLWLNENMQIYFETSWPCWFHRFMHRLLLGWVWEDLRNGQA